MRELKTCVVCGMASHRTDWLRVSGDYVACDRHSMEEMSDAIAALQTPVAEKVAPTGEVVAPTPPAPSAPATPPATPPATVGAPATAEQIAAATSSPVVVVK